MKFLKFALILFPAFLVGCAQNINPNEYSAGEIGSAHRVEKGVIVSLTPVSVNKASGVGLLAGAVAGGAAGSMIGGNTAMNVIGATGGAVAGGALGSAIENKLSKAEAIEYVIQIQDSSYLSVVEANPPLYHRGEHVLVILGPKAHLMVDPGYVTKAKPVK